MLLNPASHAALRSRAPSGPQQALRCPAVAQLRPAAACARPKAGRGVVLCLSARRAVVLSAADGEEPASDAAGSAADGSDASSKPPATAAAAWLSEPALLQALAAAKGESEALAALGEAAGRFGRTPGSGELLLSHSECDQLLETLVTSRRVPLALEVLEAMRAATADVSSSPSWRWPPCGPGSISVLVLALARSLAVPEALSIIQTLRWRGAPGGSAASSASSSLSFGLVVRCPHCAAIKNSAAATPGMIDALALVQPQEGVKRAACATCRYDFELFSGTVRNITSSALTADDGPVAAAARAASSLFGRQPASAVHELDVVSPDGVARTFRVGTPGPEVPAGVGQRVTVACAAPDSLDSLAGVARSKRDRGLMGKLIPARPPRSASGEPLEVTNHATEGVIRLVRPPAVPGVGAAASANSWVPTLVMLTIAGEGASALVDPALPALLLSGATAVTVASAVANQVVVPRMAQLPAAALTVESMRQELLQQHAALSARATAQADAAAEDVRNLGRLWQLEAKMSIVGDPELYAARLQRVRSVRDLISTRLTGRLSLLSRLARVAAMIEIEVELDSNVAAAEFAGAAAGIADEIATLAENAEVAELADAWRNTAAASDEVERLLREI